jgi:dTDP-4-amino-4,6-dideoxygalactose transaminase
VIQDLEFSGLRAQSVRIRRHVDEALARILDHGAYIMGPEVERLEHELSLFCGAEHVISCSSGTDALVMILLSLNVGRGCGVLCPSFTFAATAEAIAAVGATPIFVDIDPGTFNIKPDSIGPGVQACAQADLVPSGVIAVDLFGRPAEYDQLQAVCEELGLWLVCDAAQSFGANYKGRQVGTIGIATATSFFPAKPLGCYGDGGAIFTDNAELANVLRSIRVHGQGSHKYENVRLGINGRLDTMQAAVLLEKLSVYPEELNARSLAAERYSNDLRMLLQVPDLEEGIRSSWAQYTVRVKAEERDRVQHELMELGVPTAVYYSTPLHQQKAYALFPRSLDGLSAAETASREVLSLPMHGYLTERMQEIVVVALKRSCRSWST